MQEAGRAACGNQGEACVQSDPRPAVPACACPRSFTDMKTLPSVGNFRAGTQLRLVESHRECVVKAHDLASGLHLGAKQHVNARKADRME